MNARRSGSVTPLVALARSVCTSLSRKVAANCRQMLAFFGFAISKIWPFMIPCARNPIFSPSENSVGFDPSMKRENALPARPPPFSAETFSDAKRNTVP